MLDKSNVKIIFNPYECPIHTKPIKGYILLPSRLSIHRIPTIILTVKTSSN